MPGFLKNAGFGAVENAGGGFIEVSAEEFSGKLSGNPQELSSGPVEWNKTNLTITGAKADSAGILIRYALVDPSNRKRYLVKVPVESSQDKKVA